MKLLTQELRRRLPPLYSQENTKDPVVHCKFFTPDSSWTWLATEGSEEDGDFRFFGYVIGLEEEWGYFVLSELESARGPLGLPIDRHDNSGGPDDDADGRGVRRVRARHASRAHQGRAGCCSSGRPCRRTPPQAIAATARRDSQDGFQRRQDGRRCRAAVQGPSRHRLAAAGAVTSPRQIACKALRQIICKVTP